MRCGDSAACRDAHAPRSGLMDARGFSPALTRSDAAKRAAESAVRTEEEEDGDVTRSGWIFR